MVSLTDVITNRLPIVSLLILAAIASMASWIIFYFRPTLEFDEEESLAAFLVLLVLPVAVSLLIALTSVIRGSNGTIAAICGGVSVVLFVFDLTRTEQFDAQAFEQAALVSLLPASGLFIASRSRDAQRWPWILPALGPVAYWVGIFVAVFLSFAVLEHRLH